jgi:hypothetical protein
MLVWLENRLGDSGLVVESGVLNKIPQTRSFVYLSLDCRAFEIDTFPWTRRFRAHRVGAVAAYRRSLREDNELFHTSILRSVKIAAIKLAGNRQSSLAIFRQLSIRTMVERKCEREGT